MSFLSTKDDLPKSHGSLGWVSAGFTLFAFAAPSAVQSAPYFIGYSGILGGVLFIIANTLAAIAGSWMLLQVKLQFPSAHSFGDLGFKIFGKTGQFIGNLIQIGNFVLFLPCALLFTAQSLQGIGLPSMWPSAFNPPNSAPCWDYYIAIIALVCYLTTQLRTLSNTAIFSAISVCSVVIIAVTQLVAISKYSVTDKQPAQWFGNPSENSLVLYSRGMSIAVFGYVPSFLTAELASCMKHPEDMTKSIWLSGALNILMMLGVGIPVVLAWGYNMGYVIPLTGTFPYPETAKVDAWEAGNMTTTVLNIFVLTGNFVSYMLDSVPLGRFCQKCWAPNFKDSWSIGDILKYAGLTLPTFMFGFLCSFFFPSLDFLVNCLTFLTTPWVTMIYPAALYWKLFHAGDPTLLDGAERRVTPNSSMNLLVMGITVFGIIGVVLSAIAAIGLLVVEGTSDWQIGCQGWFILKPHD